MKKWELRMQGGFATRVECPIQIPSVDTLIRSRVGLTKRLLKETDPEKRYKLKVIRDEFDFLIESL